MVTFMVKPSKQPRYRPMRVTAEEFIRRFLQHVLPTGFQKVRHFGFMHKRSRISITWLAMLVTVTLNMVLRVNYHQAYATGETCHDLCDECGGRLIYVCHVAPVYLRTARQQLTVGLWRQIVWDDNQPCVFDIGLRCDFHLWVNIMTGET